MKLLYPWCYFPTHSGGGTGELFSRMRTTGAGALGQSGWPPVEEDRNTGPAGNLEDLMEQSQVSAPNC